MADSGVLLIAFAALAIACTALEQWRPLRPIAWRRTLVVDVLALLAYQLVIFRLAAALVRPLLHGFEYPSAVLALPLAVRLLIYVVAADFLLYWVHRLMHTRAVWRVHRWHHSPTELYWLSGVRTTLPQQILYAIVFASAFPLLRGAPDLLLFALVVDAMVQNDFMHLNVTWPSRRLEWILVTPRFHRVHHDVGMRHGNYGIRFTFWDRMFGTYVAPVPVLATGVDDKVHPLRMAIGL